MHPVLRQFKSRLQNAPGQLSTTATPSSSVASTLTTTPTTTVSGGVEEEEECREGGECKILETEGIARLGGDNLSSHPRLLLKKDSSEAFITPQNVFRDNVGGEAHSMRHQRFESGRLLREDHDARRLLQEKDFEVNPDTGLSPARAHMMASDLVTAYEQTVKAESTFQASFNNHVRSLVARQETAIGLMHLFDFVSAYVQNPKSKVLVAQLFLIAQHCRDQGVLRDGLLTIAEPSSRWLVDLISLLQTIVVQERELSVAEKVAAVNYTVLQLSKFYARKIFKTPYVPIDREVKINTFYMRVVLAILALSDDLGVYRNEKLERVVSVSRCREPSDAEFLYCLKQVLDPSSSEELNVMSETEMFGAGVGARSQREADTWDAAEKPEFSVSLQQRRRVDHGL